MFSLSEDGLMHAGSLGLLGRVGATSEHLEVSLFLGFPQLLRPCLKGMWFGSVTGHAQSTQSVNCRSSVCTWLLGQPRIAGAGIRFGGTDEREPCNRSNDACE